MKSEQISILSNIITKRENERYTELNQLESLIRSSSYAVEHFTQAHEQDLKAKKLRFNVLDCLTRHHLEELHSKFLHYLLNPNETHDCNTLFLEQFLLTLIQDREFDGIKIDIEKIIGGAVCVKRELPIDKDDDIYGRIDIFIETEILNIAIENKIWAREQDRQLERYSKYCKALNRNFIVLYLTLEGDLSITNAGREYYCLSYRHHVLSWLEACIACTVNYQMVAVGLTYYSDLINKKLFYKISGHKIMEQLKDILLKDENKLMIKYLHEFQNTIIPIRNHLRVEFFTKVIAKIVERGDHILPVEGILKKIPAQQIWLKPHRGIRFLTETLVYRVKGEFQISFCIEHDWNNLYYGLFVQEIKNEELIIPENFFNSSELDSHMSLLRDIETKMNEELYHVLGPLSTTSWWVLKRIFTINNMKFVLDELNYEFATKMDEIVNAFFADVIEYLSAWKKVIPELNNSQNI